MELCNGVIASARFRQWIRQSKAHTDRGRTVGHSHSRNNHHSGQRTQLHIDLCICCTNTKIHKSCVRKKKKIITLQPRHIVPPTPFQMNSNLFYANFSPFFKTFVIRRALLSTVDLSKISFALNTSTLQ